MGLNPRNLVLSVILVGAALTSWILARVTEEPTADAVRTGHTPQGYYMLGAVLHGTDDAGRTYYRIHAERLEQDAVSEDFVFDDLRVEYTPDAGVSWNVSASHGVTDAARTALRLTDNVVAEHAEGPDADETIFRTSDLLLNTRDSFARTNETVRMFSGGAELEASGLELDLQTDEWALAPMTAPGKSAGRFVSLMALAGTAAAQDSSTFDFRCESASGVVGEAVWVNCEFSDGTSRVTAGLAMSKRIDFTDNSWTLSDGVTLVTGSVEIGAGDAVLQFENDELVLAELEGAPLVMSDYIEGRDQRVRGSARTLSYDKRSSEVRLLGDVTFVFGNAEFGDTEFAGCDLIYNFVEGTYQTGTTDECANGFRLLGPAPEARDDRDSQADPP